MARYGLTAIENNTQIVLEALDRAKAAALEEIGLAAERFAKAETPVDTGRLRNSITHVVSDGEDAVYIGTNVEYAPYVELGTSRRDGVMMLHHAAEDHADLYGQIMRKHMQNG